MSCSAKYRLEKCAQTPQKRWYKPDAFLPETLSTVTPVVSGCFLYNSNHAPLMFEGVRPPPYFLQLLPFLQSLASR